MVAQIQGLSPHRGRVALTTAREVPLAGVAALALQPEPGISSRPHPAAAAARALDSAHRDG